MPATFEAIENEKLREQADQAEALGNYIDLVRAIATDQAPEPARVNRVRLAAGKSVSDLEADVREFHSAFEDAAIVQKAIDHRPVRGEAVKDLAALKKLERELHDEITKCRREIERQEQIIRVGDRLQQSRAAAEGRLVDRCRDYRKTQYNELGEWMKDTARERQDIEREQTRVLYQLGQRKKELAGRTKNSEPYETEKIERAIESLEAEAGEIETRLADLKARFEEARADRQQVRETMYAP